MRPLLVLVAATAVTHADSQRECHLHAPGAAQTVKQIGCFDDTRSTEDHTYGYRVCLLRSRSGVCSGVLWEWDGGPEGQALILDEATCGPKDGPVTFRGLRSITSGNGTTKQYVRSFRGKLSKRALRGTWTMHDDASKVVWKLERDGFDPLEQILEKTRAVCRPPAP